MPPFFTCELRSDEGNTEASSGNEVSHIGHKKLLFNLESPCWEWDHFNNSSLKLRDRRRPRFLLQL